MYALMVDIEFPKLWLQMQLHSTSIRNIAPRRSVAVDMSLLVLTNHLNAESFGASPFPRWINSIIHACGQLAAQVPASLHVCMRNRRMAFCDSKLLYADE